MPTLADTCRPGEPAPGCKPLDWPVYRVIVGLDIEKSTHRTNPDKRALRDRTYLILAEALHRTGVTAPDLERLTDRGDGVLALVRPVDEVPKPLFLERFVPAMCALLATHNTAMAADPPLRLRLRAVIHAGDVQDDGKGFFGEDLDLACRLLDSRPVRRTLALSTGPLVVVISDEIFRAVVRHGYGGIDAKAYSQRVGVVIGRRHRSGWIHVPETDPPHDW